MIALKVDLTEEENETLEQLAASWGGTVGDLIQEGMDVVLTEAEAATELVRRIGSGDASAEEDLVERYRKGLFFLLLRLAPEQADDLLQETFRIALERLRRQQLDEPAGLAGFLRGIARNLVIAERSKAARARSRRTETEAEDEEPARANQPTPEQLSAALLDEKAETVRQLIRKLPTERDRQLLLRFYILEEDKEHIRDDFGLDRLHFNRVLFRARQRYKELLKEHRNKRVPSLSERESELLLAINRGLPGEEAERYQELIRRRQAGVLSPEEHRDLLHLTDEVERLQAERMANLSELARLRGVPLGSLMEELEIRPASNA